MLMTIIYALALDILLIGNDVGHENDRVLQGVRGAISMPLRYTCVLLNKT